MTLEASNCPPTRAANQTKLMFMLWCCPTERLLSHKTCFITMSNHHVHLSTISNEEITMQQEQGGGGGRGGGGEGVGK